MSKTRRYLINVFILLLGVGFLSIVNNKRWWDDTPQIQNTAPIRSGVTDASGVYIPTKVTQLVIARVGATIELGDGARVQIPAGALDKDTEITIEKAGLGVASYNFLPHGTQFSQSVTVQLPLVEDDVPEGTDFDDLILLVDGERIRAKIDKERRTMTAQLTHF